MGGQTLGVSSDSETWSFAAASHTHQTSVCASNALAECYLIESSQHSLRSPVSQTKELMRRGPGGVPKVTQPGGHGAGFPASAPQKPALTLCFDGQILLVFFF